MSVTTSSLQNLRPYAKGVNGYRPPKAFREALGTARRTSVEAIDTAVELMRSHETPAATRLAACAFIWERAWGTTKDAPAEGSQGIPALRIEFVTANETLRDVRVIEHDSNSPKLEEIRDAES